MHIFISLFMLTSKNTSVFKVLAIIQIISTKDVNEKIRFVIIYLLLTPRLIIACLLSMSNYDKNKFEKFIYI